MGMKFMPGQLFSSKHRAVCKNFFLFYKKTFLFCKKTFLFCKKTFLFSKKTFLSAKLFVGGDLQILHLEEGGEGGGAAAENGRLTVRQLLRDVRRWLQKFGWNVGRWLQFWRIMRQIHWMYAKEGEEES